MVVLQATRAVLAGSLCSFQKMKSVISETGFQLVGRALALKENHVNRVDQLIFMGDMMSSVKGRFLFACLMTSYY